MAYRAEIEIIAKGVTKVTQLQKNLNQLATQIDHLNGPGSLGDFNKQLAQATKLLSRAQQGTVEEKRAIEQYVTALKNANGAQERTNNLISEEIKQRDGATAALKRYNAAAVSGRQPGGSMAGRYLRPGSAVAATQSAVPFGPAPGAQFGSTTQFGPVGGPSSSILGGQSSLVGDRIERSLRAARELDEVYESIDRIAAKSVATENQRVQALGKGTQEVVELANSYRNISGQAKTQKQLQNEIRRGIIETKKAASEEARIRSRDYLKRLELAEELGQERRNAMLLASREEETEKRINAVLERRQKQREKLKRRERFNEDLALGAGFPLLFGGGVGAVGGGVLGAVAGRGGGGFGLQILFSALGQQIDAFFAGVSEAATTVASSLGGTTETLDALGEAGIKVEQSLIDQVQSLEDAGRAVAAYDAVQKELTATYGERGLQALQTLKSANESAAESTSELNAVLQAELAPTFTLISDVSSGAAVALAKLVPVLNRLLNPFQGTPDPARAQRVARQGRIDAGVRQRTAQLETGQTVGQLSGDVSSLQRQTEIARLNNDLTNDRVVLLRQVEIITKATSEIDALEAETQANLLDTNLKQVNAARIKKIEAQQVLDLAKLEVDAQNAVASATEKATREQERAARAQERAAKIAERAAEKAEKARMKELQDRIDIAARERQKELDLEASFQKRITAIGNETALLRGQIDGNEELVRKQIEINTLVAQFGKDKRGQIELLVNEKFQVAEQNRLFQEQKQILGQIGQTLQTGVVDLIEAAVDRTKSLGEVASGVLRNLAKQFLNLGVGQLFGAFNFGGGGGMPTSLKTSGMKFFADGGRPPVGRPSIVGERGPELFVPRSSGTIVPNHAMGGSTNVVVNVDAKGTAAQGDDAQAGQLGRLIGAAVQAELIKQKRPGGLLTR